MSASRQIAVTRDYRPEPDCCIHALELLLKASPNSHASKGGLYDLTNDVDTDSAETEIASQDKKGNEKNGSVHR